MEEKTSIWVGGLSDGVQLGAATARHERRLLFIAGAFIVIGSITLHLAYPTFTLRALSFLILSFAVSFSAHHNSQPNNHLLASEWNFGDGETEKRTKAEHTFTAPGQYTVTYMAVGKDGDLFRETISISALSAQVVD